MFQLNDTTHCVEKILDLLKRKLRPTQKWACSEHYLKIINNILENSLIILK